MDTNGIGPRAVEDRLWNIGMVINAVRLTQQSRGA
jgi:hypothetical protein